MDEKIRHSNLRSIFAFDKMDIEAFIIGIMLIIFLEFYFLLTTPGLTIYKFLFDVSLSITITLIVASFYRQQRKQMGEELRIKDSAIMSSINAIALADLEGNLTYVNPSFLRMWGYDDKKEVLERPTVTFWQQKEKASEVVDALRDTGSWIGELVARRKDGSTFDAQLSANMVLDETGKPLSLMASFVDVTKLKLYEERIEAIHSHATELDIAQTIEEIAETTFNAIEGILGFNMGSFGVVEGGLLRFIHISGIEIEEPFELPLDGPGITVRAVRTGETQLVSDIRMDEDYVEGPGGRVFGTLSELDVPVRVAGKVVAVINIESTSLNAFTEEDLRLLETLAMHVASAISIIRQREMLQRSVEELERSNRELDDYTYVVSHDLKAPLRHIQAFNSFLMKDYADKLDGRGLSHLESVNEASKRMQKFIDDLLTLSRVGRIHTETEKVDLNNLLQEIEQDFEVQIKERGAQLLVDRLPTIKTQRVWMRQLFSNLISNGLKFNKSPNPRVEVGCEERQDDYIFMVKDNGIGIEQDDQKRLFNLFQRLHTRDEYEGMGAGLAINKKIVESFGGRIWVESKPGAGSTFYFTHPKKDGMAEPAPPPQAEPYNLEVHPEHAPLG